MMARLDARVARVERLKGVSATDIPGVRVIATHSGRLFYGPAPKIECLRGAPSPLRPTKPTSATGGCAVHQSEDGTASFTPARRSPTTRLDPDRPPARVHRQPLQRRRNPRRGGEARRSRPVGSRGGQGCTHSGHPWRRTMRRAGKPDPRLAEGSSSHRDQDCRKREHNAFWLGVDAAHYLNTKPAMGRSRRRSHDRPDRAVTVKTAAALTELSETTVRAAIDSQALRRSASADPSASARTSSTTGSSSLVRVGSEEDPMTPRKAVPDWCTAIAPHMPTNSTPQDASSTSLATSTPGVSTTSTPTPI